MPSILVCAPKPVVDLLSGTVLWRDGVERTVASTVDQALTTALDGRPRLIVLDRDVTAALRLITRLRASASTRTASIVVVSRSDFQPDEVDFLDAGANAIVRLPASSEDNERLARLMAVPGRKQVRVVVSMVIEAHLEDFPETVLCTGVDVSVAGMLLECAVPLHVGADLDLAFWIDGAPVVGTARVMRLAGENRYGIAFHSLKDDGGERVRRHVESNRSHSS